MYETDTLRVKIYPDESPSSPEDWGGIGKLWIFHKRSAFGFEHKMNPDNYSGWDELEEAIREREEPLHIFTVYGHDHGNLVLSLGNPRDRWDSGRIGFITFSGDDEGENEEDARKRAEAALESWNQWISGDVYRFETYKIKKIEGEVYEADNWEDCCGGFYGSDDDDWENLLDHALGDDRKKAKLVRS